MRNADRDFAGAIVATVPIRAMLLFAFGLGVGKSQGLQYPRVVPRGRDDDGLALCPGNVGHAVAGKCFGMDAAWLAGINRMGRTGQAQAREKNRYMRRVQSSLELTMLTSPQQTTAPPTAAKSCHP